MMNERLTIPEKIKIIRLVGDNVRSCPEAAMEFNVRHPERRLFNATGNISNPRPRHLDNRGHPDEVIFVAYRNNHRTSLRDMSRNLNIT